jgi:hypothetical protein
LLGRILLGVFDQESGTCLTPRATDSPLDPNDSRIPRIELSISQFMQSAGTPYKDIRYLNSPLMPIADLEIRLCD